MNNKPSKWGYKVWVLSGASGYIYGFQVSRNQFNSLTSIPDEIGKLGQVVLELTKYFPSRTHFYFDNYLGSPLLLLTLKKKGIYYTCKLRGGAEKEMKSEAELKSLGHVIFANHQMGCLLFNDMTIN